MKTYLIFFSIVAAIAAESGFDYCAFNCHINGREIKNTGCDNDGKLDSKCPPGTEMITFDETLKQFIVDQHNILRNFTAGGGNSTYKYNRACRMATIQWDNLLAEAVAFKVKECNERPVEEREPCSKVNAFGNYGTVFNFQYFFKNQSSAEALNGTFGLWTKTVLKEKQAADLMVDRNIRLGCAAASAPATRSLVTMPKKESQQYYVMCSYATDVQSGESMYAECEKAGEACKTGRNPDYPNLCSKDEQYEQESKIPLRQLTALL